MRLDLPPLLFFFLFLCDLDADLLLELDDETLVSLALDADLLSLVLDADLASDKALDAELLASLALDAELVVSLALDAGSSSPCVALELADADLVLRFSRYKSRVGAFVCFFLPDAV